MAKKPAPRLSPAGMGMSMMFKNPAKTPWIPPVNVGGVIQYTKKPKKVK
jgi:hypothetical protein